MPAMPLPFVVALLLLVLWLRVLQTSPATGVRAGLSPVAMFVGISALLMLAVGLRWSVDALWVRFLLPVLASLLPPVAWLGFVALREPWSKNSGAGLLGAGRWRHALGPLLVLGLSALWPVWRSPIDAVLAALYWCYGVALIRRASASANEWEQVRLSDVRQARRALGVVGGSLLLSGLVDALVALDFSLYRGAHAASIVAVANVLTLPLVAYALVVMGRSVPQALVGEVYEAASAAVETASEAKPSATTPTDESETDALTMSALEALMQSQHLYRDPDLTLSRLSRRLGLPARQLSGAINRTLGRNVSQVVNEYRIREAMHLLTHTDEPVTAVMLASGFQTKSNFNREFARVAGMTPSDYRRTQAAS